MAQTFYQLFGIREDAPLEEITAAWKALMKRVHPDHNPSVDPRVAQEVNRIYGVLKKPETRAQYDAQLSAARRPVFAFNHEPSTITFGTGSSSQSFVVNCVQFGFR